MNICDVAAETSTKTRPHMRMAQIGVPTSKIANVEALKEGQKSGTQTGMSTHFTHTWSLD